MLRASRERPTEAAHKWVYPKIATFVVGASLGLAGMVGNIDWLVNVAIAILAVGFLMRFVGYKRSMHDSEYYEGDDGAVSDVTDTASRPHGKLPEEQE